MHYCFKFIFDVNKWDFFVKNNSNQNVEYLGLNEL
jgi:hypothetical protein